MKSKGVYSNNIILLRIVLAVSIIILFLKFFTWYITGSNAIMADALESIVNIAASVIALISVSIAAMPKDRDHPYGHGKVEFLSAAFEGTMIFVAGLLIISKSIYNFFIPNILEEIGLGIVLSSVAGAVNFAMGHILEKTGIKTQSDAMIANGKHLKTDTYTTIGLVLGLLVIWLTNIHWLDQLIAIFFGAYILYTGFKIIKNSLAGIMDATDEKQVSVIIKLLEKHRKPVWIDIHNLRMIKYGPYLHVDCHITLPWYINLKEANDEISFIQNLIEKETPKSVELFMRVDPCISESCSVCSISDCKVRQHPFWKKIDWTLENVLKNMKHTA